MNRALTLAIVFLAGVSATSAQSAAAPQSEHGTSAAELRKQIDDTRRRLDQLEQQLAVEQQRESEEAAARQQREAEQEERALRTEADAPLDVDAKAVSFGVERSFVRNFVVDQRAMWSSPFHLRLSDANWLVPAAALSIVLVGSDTSVEKRLPRSPSMIKRANSFSNYGAFSLIGAAGGLFGWGALTHNAHQQETGLLAGEAVADSFVATELIKNVAGRARPLQDNGKGQFFGGGSSFPSEHAAAAWSAASIIAHEYPGPLTKLLAYGAASAISAGRVVGRDHFPSDVVIGGALGWFTGRQVYRAHHRGEVGGADWGTFVRPHEPPKPENMGSAYVPLDSWIYPALDRLIALGYARSAIMGQRPWTRMECARLLEEVQANLPSDGSGGETARLYNSLAGEFSLEGKNWAGDDNLGLQLESIYSGVTGISGKPLTDSYHFGETLTNNFGRPYSEGFNTYTGVSARAEAGPLAFYIRGEFQHAPAIPGYPDNVRQAISASDWHPVQPLTTPGNVNRFQLLDAYVGFAFHNFQISAGQQSLWWAPDYGGALLMSNNAQPVLMVRLDSTSPKKLPSLFSLLGPMRTQFFFGQLQGHEFPPRPYIYGQKISFKITPNLELGFSRTGIFAGVPQPLTWGSFVHSFFSYSTGSPDPRLKPGDRRAGFDFNYRIPGLRNRLILYNDSLSDDDPSPLAAPRRAAMRPGIYVPQMPLVSKLDFRAEAVYTDTPTSRSNNGQFIYWEYIYHDSHTNAGGLMGDWIGREGKGIQAWSTYWLSPRSTFQVGYRNAHQAKDFLEGGSYQDVTIRTDLLLRRDFSVSGTLQYETWLFPLLSSTQNRNVTASMQLTYWPQWKLRPSAR